MKPFYIFVQNNEMFDNSLDGNFNIMVTLETTGWGTCNLVFPYYFFAPGAHTHLHVPGVTWRRGHVFKAHLWVTPLNTRELKVLSHTRNQPNETPGGEVGLE